MIKSSMTKYILEVFIFVLLVVLDALGYLPISQTIFLLPFIWISLRIQKQPFSSIGLAKPGNMGKTIFLGIVIGIVLELFASYVTTPFLSGLFGTEPDLSELRDIEGNVVLLLFFIALSWLLAAFGEEICFRGFLMNRLAGIFGKSRVAWILSLVLSSILFGWGHTEQGITGWIQEGLSGFYLGILFLASSKNLILPVVSHGVSNTLAFMLIYLGEYP